MTYVGSHGWDTVEERFESKYIPEPMSGCWLWIGSYTKTEGYGRFSMKNTNLHAHRASWMLSRGPIPDGLFVCHKCDVRICVNPDHLFLGTHQDNMTDLRIKGRNRAPRNSGGHNVNAASIETIEAVKAIACGPGTGLSYSAAASRLGVSAGFVADIKRGTHWSVRV